MADEIGPMRALLREIHSVLLASNRAFVFVRNIEARFVGEKWCFTTQWENGGSTPAKRRTSQVVYGVFEKPLAPDFEFLDEGDVIADGGMIGPRGIRHSLVEIPVEVFERAKGGEVHVYIWGWTDYDDIFRGTKRHRTEFCLEIIVQGDVRAETCQF